jgi:hypothetical protein
VAGKNPDGIRQGEQPAQAQRQGLGVSADEIGAADATREQGVPENRKPSDSS